MSLRHFPFRLFIIVGSLQGLHALHAQLGVSPSQNAAFLRELRERHTDKTSPDPLGDDRAALQRSRSLTEPDYLSDSISSAVRLAGDYSTYSGQFQADRAFLSPWSGTLLTPETTPTGAAAPLAVALDQTFEWNSVSSNLRGSREAFLSTSQISLAGVYGSLETGRLSLQAAGGFSLAESDSLLLPNQDGTLAYFIRPGSTLSFDIQRGPFTLTLYDRVSARPDALLGMRSFSSDYFSVIQNDLGAALAVNLARGLTFTADFNWSSSQSMRDTRFAIPNRDVHSLLASLAYEIRPGWRVGLEGGQAWTNYEGVFNADGKQWHGGLFTEATVPWSHRLRLEGGAQGMSFDALPPTILFPPPVFPVGILPTLNTGDQSDLSASPYYSLTLSGRLCQSVTHELSAGYEAALTPASNYVQSHYVNYGIHTALWRGAALGLSGFLESTRDSGGLYAANTQLTGGVAQLQQKLGSKLSLTIGYGFTHIDPNAQPQSPFVSSADLNQHAYSAALAYQLCPRSSLNLGWQHFETTAPGFNFGTVRQERVTLGMRVVF
ncbi:MAG: hypothetical protein ABL974_11170 [Prosthecobacter sp.]